MRTVQGEVDAALAKLFRRTSISSFGAGRTDAGVHALAQVMTIADAPDDLDPARLRDALNGMCWPSITVTRAAQAREGFHARFSARSRTYVYAILQRDVPDPFLAGTTWRCADDLDVGLMNEAAGHLMGERDFTSFGRVDGDVSAVRRLYELRCEREGAIVRVKARANAFIQQMVRSLVGTLVEVGQGKREPDGMGAILEARDRSAAGAVAPPGGLCLVAVEYDEGWSTPV